MNLQKNRQSWTWLLFLLASHLALSANAQVDHDCSGTTGEDFLGWSCGYILGAPLRGVIVPTGETELRLPRRGWYAETSKKCPNLEREPLEIDAAGHFSGRITVSSETLLYCKDGQFTEKESIGSPEILLMIPGCIPATVRYDYASQEPILFPCEQTPASQVFFDIDHRESAGATVEISGDEILIHGARLSLPAPIDHLTSALGTPSARYESSGEGYSNDVYEWESQGVYAYARPGSEEAHRIGLVLDSKHNPRHWCNPGIVDLTVNGVELHRRSSKRKIRQAGFRKGSYGPRLRRGSFDLSLDSIGKPKVHVEVEITYRASNSAQEE